MTPEMDITVAPAFDWGETRGRMIRIPIPSAIGYTEFAQAVCR